MTTHPLILIIAAILAIGGAAVFVAGIMKSAGWADEQLEHIEPGDLMDDYVTPSKPWPRGQESKPSHEVGRQIVAKLRLRLNERN